MSKVTKEEVLEKLGTFQKTYNYEGVKHQFVLHFSRGVVLQSYDSVIAVCLDSDPTIYLGENWAYSTTTSKYRNKFLGETTNSLRELIKDGGAVVVDYL